MGKRDGKIIAFSVAGVCVFAAVAALFFPGSPAHPGATSRLECFARCDSNALEDHLGICGPEYDTEGCSFDHLGIDVNIQPIHGETVFEGDRMILLVIPPTSMDATSSLLEPLANACDLQEHACHAFTESATDLSSTGEAIVRSTIDWVRGSSATSTR